MRSPLDKYPGQDEIERIILRRLYEDRIAGFTLEMAHEIARAAIEALREPDPDASGWLPIETAPKDGQEIILFTRWDGDDEFGPEAFDAVQIGYWDIGHKSRDIFHRKPGWSAEKIGTATHWQPLPKHPDAALQPATDSEAK